MEFNTTTQTAKSFDEAVASVQDAIENTGMRVLHIHNVQQTLEEKGFSREPIKIVEFCNAKRAHDVLSIDIDMSLWLPCKIVIYQKNDKTFISSIRPIFFSQFFENLDLNRNFVELDTIISTIINIAK